MSHPDEYYVIYPVPLLGGMVATLKLPRLLIKDDAEKIARVVTALAADTRALSKAQNTSPNSTPRD